MIRYVCMAAAAAILVLGCVCVGLRSANGELKAEIRALDDALRTCMESGRTLEDNRAALVAQMQKQENACREQVKRVKDAYCSLTVEKPLGGTKSRPSLPPSASTSGDGAAPTRAKAGSTPPTEKKEREVVSYETSVSVVFVLNDAFGVFKGGDGVQAP